MRSLARLLHTTSGGMVRLHGGQVPDTEAKKVSPGKGVEPDVAESPTIAQEWEIAAEVPDRIPEAERGHRDDAEEGTSQNQAKPILVGEIAVEQGILTTEQLADALAAQDSQDEPKPIGEILSFEFTEMEIGGIGSVHLCVARKEK